MVTLRSGFSCHLWKWYALERKCRAENGGLSRGTYLICIMEVPPPPPPGSPTRAILLTTSSVMPYFGKMKQVTYHFNLSYWLRFSYFTYCALLPGHILCINTHPAKRNVRSDITIFHWCQWKWQTRFAPLQEMPLLSLASFCQSRAEYYRHDVSRLGHKQCIPGNKWRHLSTRSLDSL